MSQPRYEITLRKPNMRYIFRLVDGDGNVLLKSQYREQKPMCINEIEWIRSVGQKDNCYERLDDKDVWSFKLRAPDAHVLGIGPLFDNVSDREACIQRIRKIAQDAILDDQTPEIDLTQNMYEELQDLARQAVRNMDLDKG